jgi:phosphohistidine phosphatase
MAAKVLRYASHVQVFLVRHAEAIPETIGQRDPHRHLTAHGREQARSLGDRMRWHDCTPTHVWASPLVRAVQTAELVASGLQCDAAVEVVPALAPDGNARDVVAALRALASDAAVLLVGHEPSLSGIGALIANDPSFAGLAKAQAVRIVDGIARWRFAWDAEAPEPIR